MKWNRWESVKKGIGKGGQGSVHLVVDTMGKYAGKFALKELNNPDPKFKQKQRFKNEIEAILQLGGHPNIINIVDKSAFENKSPFYVMELVESNLLEEIKLSLNLNLKFDCFLQICEGVKFIHQNNIIHRDLKPQNILIKDNKVKIADFGICLIEEDRNRVTGEKEVVGPRFYMAPEQEDGRNLDVDKRADIYSLGKILYFILSGGSIFNREKYMNNEYNLSLLFKDDRYRLFTNLFRKTINQSKSSRYETVEDLIADFLKIRDKFLSHPRTTLENKVKEIGNKTLNNFDLLKELRVEEFNELLDIVKEKKLAINDNFINFSISKLNEKTINNLLSLLKLNPHLLSDTFVRDFANKFITNEMDINLLPNGNFLKKQIILKAIENKDTHFINCIVEKYILLHFIGFDEAKSLSDNYSLLNEENKKKLLVSLAISSNKETRNLVAKINIENEFLQELVKGLLEVADDK